MGVLKAVDCFLCAGKLGKTAEVPEGRAENLTFLGSL